MTPEQEAAIRSARQRQAIAAAQQRMAAQQPNPMAMASPQSSVSRGEAFNRGLGDPGEGMAQTLLNLGYAPPYEPSITSKKSQAIYSAISSRDPEAVAANTNRSITESERQYQSRRGPDAGVDWMRVLGNIATSAPLMAVNPAGSITKMALGNAAMGAASSAMTPVTEGDFWSEKGKQAGMGAALGGLIGAGTGAINRGVNPAIDEGVQRLVDSGVRLTPGQIAGPTASNMEQRLMGVVPFISGARRRAIEDFNRAVLNKATEPIGASVNRIGRAGIKQARVAISQAYDNVLGNLTFSADDTFRSELNNLSELARNLPEPQVKEFDRIMKIELLDKLQPTGTLDGLSFKGVESRLNQISSKLMKSQNFNENDLGRAVKTALDSMRSNLARSNPDAAEALSKVNQSRAIFESVRQASKSAGSKQGIFTPDALMRAISRLDRSKNGQMFTEGGFDLQRFADAGQEVLGNRIPNSGTPERLFTQAAATGGLGYMLNPALAAGTLGGSLMYTQPGQRIMQGLLMGQRPSWLRGASGVLARSSVPASVGAGILANQ